MLNFGHRDAKSPNAPTLVRQKALMFLIGVALSIAQFIMIRDFVTILYGEEVVIVLVTITFFFGLSVGYILSSRLSLRAFHILFAASLFLHLSFPFSYRYIAALLAAWDVDGIWFLVLLFAYALIFNAMFATFLPRLISQNEDSYTSASVRLVSLYSFELAGFAAGFLIIASAWQLPLLYLLGPYWLILGLVLFLTLQKKSVTGVYGVLAVLAVLFLTRLDTNSSEMLYEYKHGISDPKILYSVNSPYQKVEVVEGRDGTRRLYLDGLENLNSTDLESLNFYIAELPARLIQPRQALLIGNGTLSSVPKVYPYSEAVTSVELDAGVLEAGRRFFTDPATLAGFDRWRLFVDDGKHFLRQSSERYDLIVMDVPSPLTIQEAYLHTVEFYRLAQSRMTEQGVIAVQLSGPLQQNNRTPARVTAALRQVFSEVIVLDSKRADRSFAYASMKLPFTIADIAEGTSSYRDRVRLASPGTVDEFVTAATPLSVNRMDLVLRRGWERFADRYFDD